MLWAVKSSPTVHLGRLRHHFAKFLVTAATAPFYIFHKTIKTLIVISCCL